MSIVIRISESEVFENSEVSNHVCEICQYVAAHPPEFLLTPLAGKLMDLLKVLKENDITYHVQH
jgi:hypothetical protein